MSTSMTPDESTTQQNYRSDKVRDNYASMAHYEFGTGLSGAGGNAVDGGEVGQGLRAQAKTTGAGGSGSAAKAAQEIINDSQP